jgi:hypothetical protein
MKTIVHLTRPQSGSCCCYTWCPTRFRTQKCRYNFSTKIISVMKLITHVPSFMLNTKQGCANTHASKQMRKKLKEPRIWLWVQFLSSHDACLVMIKKLLLLSKSKNKIISHKHVAVHVYREEYLQTVKFYIDMKLSQPVYSYVRIFVPVS